MFGGRKCTLCGGRLDSNNVCTFCGLDNTKSDSYYRLNVSDCDHDGLTHVHEDLSERQARKKAEHKTKMSGKINQSKKAKTTYEADWEINRGQAEHKYESTPNYSGSGLDGKGSLRHDLKWKTAKTQKGQTGRQDFWGKKATKKGKTFSLILTVAIICGCGYMFHVAEEQYESDEYYDEDYDDVGFDYDPYEDITDELPETGEEVRYTLTSGNYIVGVDIPSGNYRADVQNSYDMIEIIDPDRDLDLQTYEAQTYSLLDDLRLYPGACLQIDAEDVITLISENAQTSDMGGIENPQKDDVEITVSEENNFIEIGENLEAGVYDIDQSVMDGEDEINVYVEDADGNMLYSAYYQVTENKDGTGQVSGVVLPENSYMTVDLMYTESGDNSKTLTFKPTKMVESENYSEFYEKYFTSYEDEDL